MHSVPFRPYSVPPSTNICVPNTPEEWEANVELLKMFAGKKRDQASALEAEAEEYLRQTTELRQQADKHVQQAEERMRQAAELRDAAAKFDRDQENTRKLAQFFGVNVDRVPEPQNHILQRVSFHSFIAPFYMTQVCSVFSRANRQCPHVGSRSAR
jgi:hypothetical protein